MALATSGFNRLAEALIGVAPFMPTATSGKMGWKDLHGFRFDGRNAEIQMPPLTQHAVVMVDRPPDKLELQYAGGNRHAPPPPGSIMVVPAESNVLWRWRGVKGSFHVYLEPRLIERVAADSFQRDASRTTIRPLDSQNLPEIRAVILALQNEMRNGGVAGPLMVESLANVLAVLLIRHVSGSPQLDRMDGILPRRKLATVIEFIMANLENSPTLAQLAATVHLSPYHFARQFKQATGVPPHQFVLARQVERAQQILRKNDEICLSELALQMGFCDQSQFSYHFKRIVGVTPGQFRLHARTP
jgi:AraC family transcriptional regulator